MSEEVHVCSDCGQVTFSDAVSVDCPECNQEMEHRGTATEEEVNQIIRR